MNFKVISLVTALGLTGCAAPVMAAEAPKAPEKPTCGATIQECQKQVDALQGSLKASSKALELYKQLLTEANDRLVGTSAHQP